MIAKTNENNLHRYIIILLLALTNFLIKADEIDVKNYNILSSQEIKERLVELSSRYPQYTTLTTSQEKYSLPSAGTKNDCPFDHDSELDMGCKNYIIQIEDRYLVEEVSASLPEVFISGCLHGNERVGPTVVMELVELLLTSADCEAKFFEKEEYSNCSTILKSKGIDADAQKWLARLVTTRRIIITPTTNALGYFRNQREENGIDPNRDFPYDLEDETKCMQTIAARTVNEIFREHLIQSALTFHGGMEVIAYEWGAPSYLDSTSPDDVAQFQISSAYSRYAGKFGRTKQYNYGTMNDLVYYVRGGMEDWSYAGSFDTKLVPPCRPRVNGEYPTEKTIYEDGTLRMFNMLVEASNKKTPESNSLGSTKDLFAFDSPGNGHIARNIKLSLLMIDLVEPYLVIQQINQEPIPFDMIPGNDPPFPISYNAQNELSITWTVRGALFVDDTFLIHAKPEVFLENLDLQNEIIKKSNVFQYSDTFHGATLWNTDASKTSINSKDYSYTTTIDLSPYDKNDIIQVHAVAVVDQDWASQPNPDQIKPRLPPQSHIVNARTNPNWYYETSDSSSFVQGRLFWISIPIFVNVTNAQQGIHFDFNSAIQDTYMRQREIDDDYELLFFLFIILPGILYILFMAVAYCCKLKILGYNHNYKKVNLEDGADDDLRRAVDGDFGYNYDDDDDDELEMKLAKVTR